MPAFLRKIAFFICFAFLIGVVAFRIQNGKIPVAHAIPGDLTIGSTSSNSITYINNITNYAKDLFFGNNTGVMKQDGSVGIGTTAPGAKLYINDNTADYAVRIKQNNAGGKGLAILPGSDTQYALLINNTANDTTRHGLFGSGNAFFANGAGNVGIGTTGPGQKLTVADTLAITNTGGWQTFLMGNQDSSGINNPFVMASANGSLYMGHGNSWTGSGGTRTDIMTILNGGNVGIGTTNPTEKLQVNSNLKLYYSDAESMKIGMVGGAVTWGIQVTDTGDGGNGLLLNPSGGNVGIGTTNPTVKLVLSDSMQIQGPAGNPSWPTSGAGLEFAYDVDDTGLGGAGLGYIQAYDRTGSAWKDLMFNARSYSFGIAGTRKVTIDTSGNVGIGIVNPGAKLQVDDSTFPQLRVNNITSAGESGIRIRSYGTYNSHGDIFVQNAGADEVGRMGFRIPYSATERLTILSSGNVGIGTVSPGVPLSVHRVSDGIGLAVWQNTESNDAIQFLNTGAVSTINAINETFNLSNSGTPRLTILSGGNVGIGTVSPGSPLHIGTTGWSANQLHFSSGWGAAGYHATIGSGYSGITAGGIMLGAPHIPYRVSYGAKLRFASDQAASYVWDFGINVEDGGSTDQFILRRGTANFVTVNSSGNVGIGTVSPGGKLDIVNPNPNIDGAVFGYYVYDNNFAIQSYIDNNWANRVAYAGGCCNNLALQPDVGTVSIGGVNGNYGYKFNVVGTANFTSTVTAPTFSGNLSGSADMVDGYHVVSQDRNNEAYKIVRTQANGYLYTGYINSSNGNENNSLNADRVWGTNGSDDYMRTYRTSSLNVSYANYAGALNGNMGLSRANNGSWGWNFTNDANASNIHFAHGGGYGLHVNGGSNGGGGGTYLLELYSAGLAKFTVYGNGVTQMTSTLQMGNQTINGIYQLNQYSGAWNIYNNGNASFNGTVSMGQPFWFTGSDGRSVRFTLFVNGGNYLEIWDSESGTSWGISAWASSKALKNNITDLAIDTSKIYDLKSYSYNYKSDAPGTAKTFGMMAEDVEKIIPELVAYDKDGKPHHVKLDILSVLLLNEMQKTKLSADAELAQVGNPSKIAISDSSQVTGSNGSIVTKISAFAQSFIGKLKAGVIETKKLVVDGVDILKKLNELSDKSDKQQQTIDSQKKLIENQQKASGAQQKQIEEMKKALGELQKSKK